MLSLREPPLLSPNPRRHTRNHSAPTKQTASTSHPPPVSTWPTPSSSTLPHSVPPAEPSFSQSTSFASPSSLTSPSRANMTATKILTTVRKSFSTSSSKKRQVESSRTNSPIPSHDEHHSRLAFTPSQYRFHDVASTRPTIEQIAMGLHISRTPHLRQVNRRHPLLVSDGSQDGIPPRVHAPPPARSSLKKISTLTSSSSTTPATSSVLSKALPSTTTVTSVTPSVAKSSEPIVSLKTRVMTKFLGGARSLAPLSDAGSEPSAAESGQPQARRKAVRFTSSTVVMEERAPQKL